MAAPIMNILTIQASVLSMSIPSSSSLIPLIAVAGQAITFPRENAPNVADVEKCEKHQVL